MKLKNLTQLILLMIITFQLSTPSFAQSKEQKTLEQYRIDTEIFRSCEMQKQLIADKVFKTFTQEEIHQILSNIDNEQFDNFFFNKFNKLISEEDKNHKLNEQEKFELYQIVKTKIRHITRQYGVGIAAIYFGIAIAEQIFFVIFLNLGLPSLAVISQTFPFADLFLVLSLQIKYLVKRQKIIHSYGGKDQYKIYLKVKKDLEKYYGLTRKNTILIKRDIDTSLNTVIIRKDTILEKILASVELQDQNMSLKNMLRFCKDHLLLKECKNAIQSKENQLKKIDVLSFLFKLSNTRPEIKQKFLIHFSKSFKLIDDFYRNHAFSKWSFELLNAESLQDLAIMLKSIPQNLTVYNVFEMLKLHIVPYWLEEMDDVKFKDFRKFFKNFEKVELESHAHASEPWTLDWSHKILNY